MSSSGTAAQDPSQFVPRSMLFADVEEEFDATRRLLEGYPVDADADWRPHEKSMCLSTLAGHIASLPDFARIIAAEPERNMAEHPYVPPSAKTRDELVALFDDRRAAARTAMGALDAAGLQASWRLRNGDTVYFQGPRHLLLRRFLVSHTAHHRGQLTVYYRLLGVPVPGIYGPTADQG